MILFFYDQWQTVWIITFSVAAFVLLVAACWAMLPRRMTLSVETALDKGLVLPIASFIKNVLQLFKGKTKSRLSSGEDSPDPSVSAKLDAVGGLERHASAPLSRRASRAVDSH